MTSNSKKSMPMRTGFAEFVALVASIQALGALGIDAMLPALPALAQAFTVEQANQRQLVISIYLLGYGAAQIFYGPIADRFGRKKPLLFGIGIYCLCSIAVIFTTSFATILTLRFIQGVGAAGTRVLPISIVRDRFEGRQMAQVQSLVFVAFLVVPILAPSVGQVIIIFSSWRGIFWCFALFSAFVWIWVRIRLSETIHPENRRSLTFFNIFEAFKFCLTNRMAVSYTLASTFMIGSLFGFINSAQQVFSDALDAAQFLPVGFAISGSCLAISSVFNVRFVGRFGMRRLSHYALIVFILITLIHLAIVWRGYETLVSFTILQALMLGCFGLIGPNFGAIAMEPLGHVAGTASSIQGFVTTVGGALIGLFIGQHFNGTVLPLTLGYFTCGMLALLCVVFAEKGRLARRTHTMYQQANSSSQ